MLSRFFFILILIQKYLATPLPTTFQNSTIDDHDLASISYASPNDWSHSSSPDQKANFFDGSLSHTRVPGSSATLIFTGRGVWLLGPFALDQAQRRVYLDGDDMGVFNASEGYPGRFGPFWGVQGLEHAIHRVVVVHNDSEQTVLSMDAWIVEADSSLSSSKAFDPAPTPFSTDNERNRNNTSTQNLSTGLILLSIIIPAISLLLCCGGLLLCHTRRAKKPTSESHHQDDSEKPPAVYTIPVLSSASEFQVERGGNGPPAHNAARVFTHQASAHSISCRPGVSDRTEDPFASAPDTPHCNAIFTAFGIPPGPDNDEPLRVSNRTHDPVVNTLNSLHLDAHIVKDNPPLSAVNRQGQEFVISNGRLSDEDLSWSSNATIPAQTKVSPGNIASSTTSDGHPRTTLRRPSFSPAPLDPSSPGLDPSHEDERRGLSRLATSGTLEKAAEYQVLPSSHKPQSSMSPASKKGRLRGKPSSELSYNGPTIGEAGYFGSNNAITSIFGSNAWGGVAEYASSLPYVTAPPARQIPSYSTAGSSNTSHYPETPITGVPTELGTEFSNEDINSRNDVRPQFHWSDGTFSSFDFNPIPTLLPATDDGLWPGLTTSSLNGLPVQPPAPHKSLPDGILHYFPDNALKVTDRRLKWQTELPESRSSVMAQPGHHEVASYLRVTNQELPGPGGVQMIDPAAVFMTPFYNPGSTYVDPSTFNWDTTTSGLSLPPQTHRTDGPSYSNTPSSATVSSPPDSLSSPPTAGTAIPHTDLIHSAFGADSDFRNDALAEFCRLIKESTFVSTHQLEPSISSSSGQALISMISHLPGCPPTALHWSDRSIFTLLVDCRARRCLICRSVKTSVERAVGCIRSHFQHRPFVCGGEAAGCLSCRKRTSPQRFFASSYLDDHIKGQLNKFPCPEITCNTSVRRGGMEKHWKSMHKGREFPKETFPGYGKRKKATVTSVSSQVQFP